MDSSSSEGTGQPLSRNQSYSAITAAQLAAAIANATGNFPQSSNTTQPSSGTVITSEMFSQAMQQAFATVSPTATPAGPTATTPSNNLIENMDSLVQRLSPQLQQMREMGLTNDVINVQALQATSGDVQAAIDLVFSGAMSPD